MKKTLRNALCILFALFLLFEPVHIDDASNLNELTSSLISSCIGSVSDKEADEILTNISAVQSDNTKKTITATADGNIKYASLKAVNPMSNPTSLDDFTLISTPGTISTSGGTLRYLKKVKVEATAYCSCYSCCGPYDGTRTADGSRPREYYTIATSRFFSFGTMVYIPYFDWAPNNGVFEVEDRGGAIQNNRIDIYFSTHEKALQFGRRSFEMYILE